MPNKTIIMLLIGLFCLPFPSFAYETIKVSNGGSIEGIVEFAGTTIPQDKTLAISSDVKYCGRELRTEKYLISAERRIKNVVVYIKEIKAGKAIPNEPLTVTDLKCSFIPHVSVGFKGNKFIARNEDGVLHTIHIYTSISGKTMFNIALPEKSSTLTKTFTKTGLMEMNCDCHPWMQAFVYVFDQPYAAVTDEKGVFVMKDVPPGTYTIEAWHEALGNVELAVLKVEGGKTSKIKVTYTSQINLY